MHLHRFYVGQDKDLKHDFWLHDEHLLWQWQKVLRYKPGQEVILFDGLKTDRLYRLMALSSREAHLVMITELAPKIPLREIYLLWSLLKKDKNDWVLQKGTELGVSHFWPLIADRSEKTGFNIERAKKIIIEASEQCERSDMPSIREPLQVDLAIKELAGKADLFVAEKTDSKDEVFKPSGKMGVLVGPEGGWSDGERELFAASKLTALNLHDFTLRAETATITAVLKLIT